MIILEKKAAEASMECIETSGNEPLYVPADNPLVQKLKSVYKE